MVFNSYIFIIYFLPITICGWYLIGRKWKRGAELFLLGMSFWFYGYFNLKYLLLLIVSIIVNYAFSRLMHYRKNKRIWLVMGLFFNIGIIFYFKYFDFFVENMNKLFSTSFNLKHILLPLGISFFTFQQIAFVVDSYHGEAKDYDLIEYAVFVSYFPQLVAGPIVLHSEFIPQLRKGVERKFFWENLSVGVRYFIIGLFKKMMIADVCGSYVNWGFENVSNLSSPEALLVMLCYTAQIYFDFSGYSDMAIGLGRMMGFELPMNFNSPYRSSSINEFWDRWHITLTRFLRTYIYFPLGGSRKGTVRKYINIMIVFLISGLWHGANWTFVIWGGIHGTLNVTERIIQDIQLKLNGQIQKRKFSTMIGWIYTYLSVSVLWLLFRADSVAQWLQILTRMFSFSRSNPSLYLGTWTYRFSYRLAGVLPFGISGSALFECLMALLTIILIVVCLTGKNIFEQKLDKYTLAGAIGMAMLAIVLILSLGADTQFIYFNF